MIRSVPRLLLPAIFAAMAGVPSVAAGGSAPSGSNGCPARTVCDRALGVALIVPAGWQRVPPGHFPSHVLAWFTPPPRGLDYNIRLLLQPDGTTRDRNNARAAANAADKLIAGYRGHVHVTRSRVRYGATSGILIRGLPGGPGGPDTFIILAHRGALYSIIAPGSRLAADQRRAITSVRFFPRVGPFPRAAT